jgi:hypothetical protein
VVGGSAGRDDSDACIYDGGGCKEEEDPSLMENPTTIIVFTNFKYQKLSKEKNRKLDKIFGED